jgi:anti-sigma factor RsiW
MLSHATARDWLIPYADGMLASDEGSRIDSHINGCAACAAELQEVRELNLLLVTLPPAPPVAFAPFWLKLQATLPQRRQLRIPTFARYRRLGLAFAMAAILAVAAATAALAAPSALPDSPLYSVKQLEESVHLAIVPSSAKLPLQMQLAGERLREAKAMAVGHKPLLAAHSLRAFGVIVNEASTALKHPADPRVVSEDLRRLHTSLDEVERVNVSRNEDDAAIKQLVASDLDEIDRIEQSGASTTGSPLIIGTGTETTPQPTPQPTPKPTPRPTPRPTPTDEGDQHGHRG